jgi:hypothetical protein
MNELFLKIENKSVISTLILGYASNTTNWTTKNGFLITTVPDMLLKFDPFLANMKQTFGGNAIIFKMNPNSFYRFHVDEKRAVAINLLIDGFDGDFYFGTQGTSEEVTENIIKCDYEPDTYFLINTKEKHAVLNRSTTRYVLSLGFKNHNFSTVRDYCIENMFIQ